MAICVTLEFGLSHYIYFETTNVSVKSSANVNTTSSGSKTLRIILY